MKPAFRQETLTSALVVIINKDLYVLILSFEIFDMKLWSFAYFPQEKSFNYKYYKHDGMMMQITDVEYRYIMMWHWCFLFLVLNGCFKVT